jgi:hypothetical protein
MNAITSFGRTSVFVLRFVGVLIGSALGLSMASLKSSSDVALADTECYFVNCFPSMDSVCKNHHPSCNGCFNRGGAYCGGPC